jgi:hypothetical protein
MHLRPVPTLLQVRISKITGLLLTRVAFQTCSGMPGTVITIAEAAAVSRSSLTIVGPPKLGLFMNALAAYSDIVLNKLHLEINVRLGIGFSCPSIRLQLHIVHILRCALLAYDPSLITEVEAECSC